MVRYTFSLTSINTKLARCNIGNKILDRIFYSLRPIIKDMPVPSNIHIGVWCSARLSRISRFTEEVQSSDARCLSARCVSTLHHGMLDISFNGSIGGSARAIGKHYSAQ